MLTVTAAIISHARPKKLPFMVYQVENQIEPYDKIKLYVSGYEPEQLAWCKYPISYQHDRNDWGHQKRAIACSDCDTDYIVCCNDDDIYLFHFLQRLKEKAEQTKADIVYNNFYAHNRAGTQPYIDAKPEYRHITSGCMMIKTEFIHKHPNTYSNYGADGWWVNDAIKAGATTAKVDECLSFHY